MDDDEKKPKEPSEYSLDFNDGRTSSLERYLAWFLAACAAIGLLGNAAEIYQAIVK